MQVRMIASFLLFYRILLFEVKKTRGAANRNSNQLASL